MSLVRTKTPSDKRIFFPWEGRGGLRRFFAVGRVGPIALFLLVLSFVWWVGARERVYSGERQTRVSLALLRTAVQRYQADHEGRCPAKLDELLVYLKKESVPADGWGRPFRLICPGDRPGIPFLLMSDGPDGRAGGLDRIEF